MSEELISIIDRTIRALAVLSQDIEAMEAKVANNEDPNTASKKSIEPMTRLRQPDEELLEKDFQYIDDLIRDAFGE